MLSMHRMQKYTCHTASLMLVWLVFCVGVVCSELLPANAEHLMSPAASSSQVHHRDMTDAGISEHGAGSAHASHAMQCCEGGEGEHEMTNLLSASSWLISLLTALAITIGIPFFPVLRRFDSPGLYQSGQAPPNSGYPPVFLTIQHLLN